LVDTDRTWCWREARVLQL